jgi:hypothetical protein
MNGKIWKIIKLTVENITEIIPYRTFLKPRKTL